MATIRQRQEKTKEARMWAARTVEGARHNGDQETLARALILMDLADQELGLVIDGGPTREALEIFVQRGESHRESVARANLGVYAGIAGRWGEAESWFVSSRRAAVEAGNDFGAAETDLQMADILILQGRLDEAEATLLDASRVVRASGMEYYIAYAEMLQARLTLARGYLDAAEGQAARVARLFLEMGSPVSALEASHVRAEAAIGLAQYAPALALLNEAEDAARGEGGAQLSRTNLLRAQALLGLGRLQEAVDAVEAGLLTATTQNIPYDEALLLMTRSEISKKTGGADAEESSASDAARSRLILEGLAAYPG